MSISKREFLTLAGVSAGVVAVGVLPPAVKADAANAEPDGKLSPITGDVASITVQERLERIARAFPI